MIVRKVLFLILCFSLVSLLINSCKDRGHDELTPPLVSSSPVISIVVGGSATVTINGGNPPYAITEQPNSAVATASLVNNTLTVNAVGAGTTQVKISDSDSDAPGIADPNIDSPAHNEQEITIPITVSLVPPLVATPPSVTVGSGASVNVTISQGNPPYSIVQIPDASLATAQFVDPNVASAILQITGVTNASASGPTSVRVHDSKLVPSEVDIPITKTP